MPTCPKCGDHGVLVTLRECTQCDRVGCERCMLLVGRVPRNNDWAVWVCDRICFTQWAHKLVSLGYELTEPDEHPALAGVRLVPGLVGNVQTMREAHTRKTEFIQAGKFVDAARYEEAAKIYERYGLYKKAGETRRLAQHQTVTHVHVNVNDLVDQLGRMGLSAKYVCPICGGPFTVTPETRQDELTKCRHCGAVIRPTDLVEAIAKVVGAP